MADILGMIAQGGSGMGSGLLGNFLQAKQTTATQRLMGPAMAGDPNAMQELMGVNPELGMQAQAQLAQQAQQAAQADFRRQQLTKQAAFQKGAGTLTRNAEGQVGYSIPITNPNTGETTLNFVPINGEILGREGMTFEEKQEAKAKGAGQTEREKLEAKKELSPEIKAAEEKAVAAVELATAPEIERQKTIAAAEARIDAANADELIDLEARIPAFEDMEDKLLKLSTEATFSMGGKAFDEVVKQFGYSTKGADARAKYISIIDNEVLPLLRQTFGAAFTEKEGETLKATLGDPNATPSQKQAQLQSFMEAQRRKLEVMKRKIAARKGAQAPSATDTGAADAELFAKYGIEG